MEKPYKMYLGDSVYGEIKDGQIILTTENGYGPSNLIVLEPEVYESLTQFVERFISDSRAASGPARAERS